MRFISVIVPIYYGKKYITGMIFQVENCKKQLEFDDHIELIFVNDTPEIPLTEKLNSNLIDIIVLNTNENVGIQGARIKGLKEARGEYILFLDQDDLIKPEYFYSQLLTIKSGDAVICKAIHNKKEFYSDDCVFEKVVRKDKIVGEWNAIVSPGQVLLKKQSIPETWTRNILKYNGADDWFLWVCMIAKECVFSLNNDILYEHIMGGDNYSENRVNMLRSEQEVIRTIFKKNILSDEMTGKLLDGFFIRNLMREKELQNINKKYNMLNRWKELQECHIKISDYLIANNLKKIAIYGCGDLGKHLYVELKEDINLKIEYFIDRNANKIKQEVPVYTLQDNLPEVDCIIITLIDGIEGVKKQLENVFSGNILVFKEWLRNKN